MSVTEITDFSGGLDVVTTVADYGDQALILQCDSTSEVLAWTEALRGRGCRVLSTSSQPRSPSW